MGIMLSDSVGIQCMMMEQDGVPVAMGIIGERGETFTLCIAEAVSQRYGAGLLNDGAAMEGTNF